MNSKRKFSDFNADSSAQGESREFIPGSHASKKLKEKNGKKNKTKPGSMNWVKKRVRTIERRFKAGHNMPANVQNDLERELAHYQQTIVETADEKKRKAMIKKYHMVRFFGESSSFHCITKPRTNHTAMQQREKRQTDSRNGSNPSSRLPQMLQRSRS